MNANLMKKCRLFATEIKKKSGSFFTDNPSYYQFENLNQTYLQVLRCKRNAIEANYNDPYYHFTAKNESLNEIQSFVLRPSHNFTNDQILKIIISVNMFFLSHDKIKEIIEN